MPNCDSLFDVKGLVAVVTGGGSGIGLMMTNALATHGATVYIVGRRKQMLEQVASEFKGEGKIIPLPGDVSSKESLQSMTKFIESREGYINLLVNNAGILGDQTKYTDAPIDKITASIDEWQKYYWSKGTLDDFSGVFKINVAAVWYTTVAFIKLLSEGNKHGPGLSGITSQIISISSIGSYLRGVAPLSLAYETSKTAVNQLGKTLMNMLAPHNIRSNVIAPGMFPSDMLDDAAGNDAANIDYLTQTYVPAKRTGNSLDMGGLLLFHASRAGAYLNGNITVIDGGRVGTTPSTY